MSKYYKEEDIIKAIKDDNTLTMWQEQFAINTLKSLQPIKINEDCISKEQAIEAIDEVDWYHVDFTGELVHGAASDDEAWYKAEDIYKAIESLPSGENAFRVI